MCIRFYRCHFSLITELAKKLETKAGPSEMFNDTMRLRNIQRTSLGSMFSSHEEPNVSTRPQRPKEPPPPPPPVASVLLPVTPPKHFSQEVRKVEEAIKEENEDDSDLDLFSTDEFSSDEEEVDGNPKPPQEPTENFYENFTSSRTCGKVKGDMDGDSLEEKISFSEEYETEEYDDVPPPLPNCPPPPLDVEEEVKDQSLIEKSGDKMIIFTSAQMKGDSSHEMLSDKRDLMTHSTSNNKTHQILISSSSWIDLQGSNSIQTNVKQSS